MSAPHHYTRSWWFYVNRARSCKATPAARRHDLGIARRILESVPFRLLTLDQRTQLRLITIELDGGEA